MHSFQVYNNTFCDRPVEKRGRKTRGAGRHSSWADLPCLEGMQKVRVGARSGGARHSHRGRARRRLVASMAGACVGEGGRPIARVSAIWPAHYNIARGGGGLSHVAKEFEQADSTDTVVLGAGWCRDGALRARAVDVPGVLHLPAPRTEYFVPGLPHVMLIELRRAFRLYQDGQARRFAAVPVRLSTTAELPWAFGQTDQTLKQFRKA